jgi:hypothetical protein
MYRERGAWHKLHDLPSYLATSNDLKVVEPEG